MPAEIDFSEGVRGKFYKPDLRLIPPVRLEPQVQDTLLNWAAAKGVDYNTFVTDLLKKSIKLIEVAR